MPSRKLLLHFSTKNLAQSRRTVRGCGCFDCVSIWHSIEVRWFPVVHPASFPATIRFKSGDHVRVKFGVPEKSSLSLVVTNVEVCVGLRTAFRCRVSVGDVRWFSQRNCQCCMRQSKFHRVENGQRSIRHFQREFLVDLASLCWVPMFVPFAARFPGIPIPFPGRDP
jgi:hypothetical protein